jgi:hypothetical protein
VSVLGAHERSSVVDPSLTKKPCSWSTYTRCGSRASFSFVLHKFAGGASSHSWSRDVPSQETGEISAIQFRSKKRSPYADPEDPPTLGES